MPTLLVEQILSHIKKIQSWVSDAHLDTTAIYTNMAFTGNAQQLKLSVKPLGLSTLK